MWIHDFEENLTKSVGPVLFSAEYQICRHVQMDGRTDELIWGGLGNLRFLQVNPDIRHFYAACCFDELSRGSVLRLLNASFGKRFHNATNLFFRPKIDDHGIRRSDMG